jgi:glutamyl-tRNA reductase
MIDPVLAILAQEESAWVEYQRTSEMLPVIAELREQAEEIRRGELERTLRRLPDLTEAQRERIDAMTSALVKKLLEHPTHRLRAEAASPNALEYAHIARTLFGLSGSSMIPNMDE